MLIREAVLDDAYRGIRESLASLGPVNATCLEVIRHMRLVLANPSIKMYVAVDEGAVVGVVSLTLRPTPLHECSYVGHIEDLAVRESHQKAGVGTALVLHCLAEANKIGAYKVTLFCRDGLAPFYSKFGFVSVHAMRSDVLL